MKKKKKKKQVQKGLFILKFLDLVSLAILNSLRVVGAGFASSYRLCEGNRFVSSEKRK